ncbi:hypothetical protein FACS1894152_7520 [Bacilli bacterium]|nr:hypothetical protein FACS1894152_7520 [Bacilli bacterium]
MDNSVAPLVRGRISRVEDGNYGDFKLLGGGVFELRFWQGYHIYFTEVDKVIVLLFCGGDKSDQRKDIERAKKYKEILDEKGLEYCLE